MAYLYIGVKIIRYIYIYIYNVCMSFIPLLTIFKKYELALNILHAAQ